MILFIWALGAVILGVLVLVTRGKAVYIDARDPLDDFEATSVRREPRALGVAQAPPAVLGPDVPTIRPPSR